MNIEATLEANIEKLATAAGEHGDIDQVELCRKALLGNKEALWACIEALADNDKDEAEEVGYHPEGVQGLEREYRTLILALGCIPVADAAGRIERTDLSNDAWDWLCGKNFAIA